MSRPGSRPLVGVLIGSRFGAGYRAILLARPLVPGSCPGSLVSGPRRSMMLHGAWPIPPFMRRGEKPLRRSSRKDHLARLVGTDRFELSTSRLSVVRSNQLSYAPALVARNLALRLNGRDSLGGGLNCLQQTHPLFFLRKEVIQPQIPLRLPCYDFTPVADLTVVGCLLCRLAHRLQVKPTPMV